MKTFLVTGGAGFIGSNFIQYMLKLYDDVKIVNLDKLTYAGNLENLKSVSGNSNYKFVHGDICDKKIVESIFTKNDIDYVVNFAAESHVDRSIDDPEVFIKTNVLGTFNLLDIAKNFWYEGNGVKKDKKFLQISTDEVYGSLGRIGYFTETSKIDPHSPYSASKAAADMMVKAYYDTYGMPVNITRCSNNYGPYQFPEKLIPLIIKNCITKNPIPVYGDGLNIRDWIYVEDHCKAIDMVLKYGKLGQVYNIGAQSEKTNIEIVRLIIGYIQKNFDNSIDETLIKYVEDRKGHDRRYAIDAAKINEELGWKPDKNFEEGIKITIDWYLNNNGWMKNVISKDYIEYYSKVYGA